MKPNLNLSQALDPAKDLALDIWEDLSRTRMTAVAIGLGLTLLAITALAFRPAGTPEVPAPLPAAEAMPTEEVSFAIPGEKPMRIKDLNPAQPRDPFQSLGDLAAGGSTAGGPDEIVTASASPSGSGGGTVASYTDASALVPLDDLGGGQTAPVSAPPPRPPTETRGGSIPVSDDSDSAPRTDYSYAADLQFGPLGGLKRFSRVQRLGLIPSRREPYLMYLGVRPNYTTAVFMVDSRLSQGGEGRCVPKPSRCTFLELEARPERDEHRFRDADGNEYMVRLRKLVRTTASAGSVGERDAANLRGAPPLLDGSR